MAKVYSLTIRNRAVAFVIVIAVLGLGAVFLTIGLAVLAGLAVAGGLIGTGFAIARRLRRGGRAARYSVPSQRVGLDPALEVQPKHLGIVGPADNDAGPATKQTL